MAVDSQSKGFRRRALWSGETHAAGCWPHGSAVSRLCLPTFPHRLPCHPKYEVNDYYYIRAVTQTNLIGVVYSFANHFPAMATWIFSYLELFLFDFRHQSSCFQSSSSTKTHSVIKCFKAVECPFLSSIPLSCDSGMYAQYKGALWASVGLHVWFCYPDSVVILPLAASDLHCITVLTCWLQPTFFPLVTSAP